MPRGFTQVPHWELLVSQWQQHSGVVQAGCLKWSVRVFMGREKRLEARGCFPKGISDQFRRGGEKCNLVFCSRGVLAAKTPSTWCQVIKEDFKVTCTCSMFMCFDFPALFLMSICWNEIRFQNHWECWTQFQISSIKMHLSSVYDRKKSPVTGVWQMVIGISVTAFANCWMHFLLMLCNFPARAVLQHSFWGLLFLCALLMMVGCIFIL